MLAMNFSVSKVELDNVVILNGYEFHISDEIAEAIQKSLEKAVSQRKAEFIGEYKPQVKVIEKTVEAKPADKPMYWTVDKNPILGIDVLHPAKRRDWNLTNDEYVVIGAKLEEYFKIKLMRGVGYVPTQDADKDAISKVLCEFTTIGYTPKK